MKLAGAWRKLTHADGPVLVARDVRHELRNESTGGCHLRCRVTPGGRLDAFLTETARAARAGLYNARNLPTSVAGARWIVRLAREYADETVMCSSPPAVQRVVLPIAARLLGVG